MAIIFIQKAIIKQKIGIRRNDSVPTTQYFRLLKYSCIDKMENIIVIMCEIIEFIIF